ncbi:MAG: alpha-1,4-glucan--maltose-1-phosphate maltosyltransferase [Chloroflexaceae bacterium]|nr:alpha-1,4-glucan--maltose-1-phosphate maltosyltransferase [Chloroflexaceae bacterium]
MSNTIPTQGRSRVIIEGVSPEIDGGYFPIKRVVGETVEVEADIFTDGHDAITCLLLYRKEGTTTWNEAPMEFLVNDRWRGHFVVAEQGTYVYTIEAWVDRYQSWERDMEKRVKANQNVSVDLLIGAELLEAGSVRAKTDHARKLRDAATILRRGESLSDRIAVALDRNIRDLMLRYSDRRFATRYARELKALVERKRAGFSSWYELFPRSYGPGRKSHGTFKDCEAHLPYVASMGFDVIYFPPIHPIGQTMRKGRNNSLFAEPTDTGSPWAIGSAEGGHKSIHPKLGTLQDFRSFVAKAKEYGIDIALDIAFQCSPDHPYVTEHPEWFRKRPDGTIQYAENPPKKYQDIYPFDFETEKWQELWEELKSVFLFWIKQGVEIFRVDNPHTKSFAFWEWAIQEIRQQHPNVIFLSEAFTRPKVMYRLAKLGFTQSYTYFAWRNDKAGLIEYLTELTQGPAKEFFRPNFWPNTPDILNEYLQHGGRPAFMIRLVLAATMTANYGIYGPAYELCVNVPREPGSEEYLDSEKYEIKNWNLDSLHSIKSFITQVNKIRRENPALQSNRNLQFHRIDNDKIICYSKHTDDYSNIILVVATLDYTYTQSGWVEIPVEDFGIDANQPYQVYDLLNETGYFWNGAWNYIELRPHEIPVHIFRLQAIR